MKHEFKSLYGVLQTLRKLRKQRPWQYPATQATPPWWLIGWGW